MQQSRQKDNSQAVFNAISQVILNGTNFVLIMIFTRFLSTEDYGVVSIYQAYVLFFAVLVGLNTQGSIPPAFVSMDEKRRDEYLSSIMLLSLISLCGFLTIAGVFMGGIVRLTNLSAALILLMLLHSFGQFCFNFVSIKYVYMRKAQYSCLLAFLVAALMIILSLVGVVYAKETMPDYLIRILSLAIPYVSCAVIVLALTFYKSHPFYRLKESWRFCIPICIPMIFHGISQVVLSQTDKIMMEKLTLDYTMVGIYSFTVTFVHILNSIYTALNNTWVPIYYSYLKVGDVSGVQKRGKRYSTLFLVLTCGFMMVAPEFVKLFADSDYWSGIYLIPIVAGSIFMTFLYSFAVNYEIFHKETKLIALGTMCAAVCNIVLNAILIPKSGMYGAAIATLISYVALCIFHSISANYIEKIHPDCIFPFKKNYFFAPIILVCLFSAVFYLFLDMWLLRWGIAVALAGWLSWNIYKNKSLF